MLFNDNSKVSFDKHIQHIYAKLAERFNFPVKPNCKYYQTSCEMIMSIYNGTFFQKYRIDLSKAKDFDISNNKAIIEGCKGSWVKVKNLVLNSYDHLQLVKDERYLPYGKKFYQELKLSGYFGGQIGTTYQCPFYLLISKPLEKQAYFQDKFIDEVKDHLKSIRFNSILETANSICKEKKFNKKDTYYFWMSLQDLCNWWERVKKYLPQVYSSLKSSFSFRNLLEDYYEWLKECLINQQGGHYILSPWYFKAGEESEKKITGYFSRYLLNKVERNQVLKSLSKNICFYYLEDSFKSNKIKQEKEIVEEDIIF